MIDYVLPSVLDPLGAKNEHTWRYLFNTCAPSTRTNKVDDVHNLVIPRFFTVPGDLWNVFIVRVSIEDIEL